MAKSKMGTNEQELALEKKEETSGVPAKNTGMQMAVGAIAGDFNASDFEFPRLNLVQKTGALGDIFSPGTFVLNKEEVLINPNKEPTEWSEPLTIIVLSMKKQFQERKPFDPESPPDTYDTLDEVLAIPNASLEWVGDVEPTHQPIMTYLLLVQSPLKDRDDLFPLAGPDENDYEVALFTVASTAYRRLARPINSKTSRRDKKGLPVYSTTWKIATRREVINGNSVFVLKANIGDDLDEAMLEFAKTALD